MRRAIAIPCLAALALGTALALCTAVAGAQDVFRNPVRLGEPMVTHEDFVPLGIDADGWVYTHDSGHVGRYDPADPQGTFASAQPRYPGIGNPVRVTGLLMTADLDGVWALAGDAQALVVHRVRQNDWAGAETWTLPFDADPDWQALSAALDAGGAEVIAAPDGVCLRFDHAIHCVDPAAGAVRRILDLDTLAAAMPPLPRYGRIPEPADGTPERLPRVDDVWRIDHALFVPDGRAFVAVARRAAIEFDGDTRVPDGVGEVGYLLEVGPAGDLSVRYGPIKRYVAPGQQPTNDPLRIVGLVHWPARDAIAAHITGWDYGWRDVDRPDLPLGHDDNRTHGWRGQGLRIFPLDGGGRGWLSLTDPVIRRLRCAQGAYPEACQFGATRMLRHPDGDLRVVIETFPGPDRNRRVVGIHPLDLDEAALDLDGDGLPAAAEAEAGTSDLHADTDGGGDDDFGEVALLGTDPTDAGDDPVAAMRAASPVNYRSSPLVRLRLAERASNPKVVETVGAVGPLCFDYTCYAADGTVVLRYDDVPGHADSLGVRSADGSHLVLTDSEAIHRIFFEDGRRETLVTLDDLRRIFDRSPELQSFWGPITIPGVRVVPVDRHRTWLINGAWPARVVLLEDGEPRVMYDAETARCDSGYGPCDDGPMPDAVSLLARGGALPGGGLQGPGLPVDDIDPDGSMPYVGYDPLTERLQIGVYGNWQTWLLGLHATRPPLVLGTQHDLRRPDPDGIYVDALIGQPVFPAWSVPTGDGMRLTDRGLFDATRAPIAADVAHFAIRGRPLTVWGDTLVYDHYTGSDYDGFYELVRTGGLEPGDLIALTFGGRDVYDPNGPWNLRDALTLYHGKARGGLNRVWVQGDDVSAVTDGPLVRGLVGMDVTPDGRLCVTDGEVVVTFEGIAENGLMPAIPIWRAPLPGAVGCAFDGPDLLGLTAAPAAVHAFEPGRGAFTFRRALEQAPEGFMRTLDGALAIRYPGPAATDLDDTPLDPTEAAAHLPDPASAWSPGLRPDGIRVDLTDGRLVATDLWTEATAWYAFEPLGEETDRVLYMIVPGGEPRDPWTGEWRMAPAPPPARPAPLSAAPAVSAEPSAGGCATTPGRPAPTLLSLWLLSLWLLALAITRRART